MPHPRSSCRDPRTIDRVKLSENRTPENDLRPLFLILKSARHPISNTPERSSNLFHALMHQGPSPSKQRVGPVGQGMYESLIRAQGRHPQQARLLHGCFEGIGDLPSLRPRPAQRPVHQRYRQPFSISIQFQSGKHPVTRQQLPQQHLRLISVRGSTARSRFALLAATECSVCTLLVSLVPCRQRPDSFLTDLVSVRTREASGFFSSF